MSESVFKVFNKMAEKVRDAYAVEYDLSGIKTIEQDIINSRPVFATWEKKKKEHFVSLFGSFLGKCLIENCEGAWVQEADRIGVRVQNYTAYPFQQVWELYGKEAKVNSLSSFYKSVPELAKALKVRE